jgi:hypothetical protein
MKYFTILGFSVLLFSACNKDDEPKQPSKTELLTSQSWKYDSGGVDQDRNGTIDFTFASTGLLQPCILDNTGTFNANGTGVADEGATKCSLTAPQTNSFTWNFLNNETELNVVGPAFVGIGGKFNVKELSSTVLTLTKDTAVVLAQGLPPTTIGLVVTLKH